MAQRPAVVKQDKFLALAQLYNLFERDLGVEEKIAIRQAAYGVLGLEITAQITPDQSRFLDSMTYAGISPEEE
jgi:hypothetical protein